jgi:hypothetical protein
MRCACKRTIISASEHARSQEGPGGMRCAAESQQRWGGGGGRRQARRGVGQGTWRKTTLARSSIESTDDRAEGVWQESRLRFFSLFASSARAHSESDWLSLRHAASPPRRAAAPPSPEALLLRTEPSPLLTEQTLPPLLRLGGSNDCRSCSLHAFLNAPLPSLRTALPAPAALSSDPSRATLLREALA